MQSENVSIGLQWKVSCNFKKELFMIVKRRKREFLDFNYKT